MSFERIIIVAKTALALICVVFTTNVALSQSRTENTVGPPKERTNAFSLYGGMGVKLAADPALVDYVNTLVHPSQRVDDFATVVEFFGGVEFPVSNEWGGAIEYSYLFKSYTLPTFNAGTYTLFYNVHMPTLMVQYVLPGAGYFVKFGAGMGYHAGSISETNSLYGTDSTYTARGVGIKAAVLGQTAFDEHLFGYISGDLRWEFLGKVKNAAGNELWNQGQTASLSMFVVGVAFGLIYYF